MSKTIVSGGGDEVRRLTGRMGAISTARRNYALSAEARRALVHIDQNRVQNAERVAISGQNTATAVTLAAINTAGVEEMATVHADLAAKTIAASATLGEVAMAAAIRSSQRCKAIEEDLLRRRDAGELSEERCTALIERARKADEQRETLAFNTVAGTIEDLTSMSMEARRGTPSDA